VWRAYPKERAMIRLRGRRDGAPAGISHSTRMHWISEKGAMTSLKTCASDRIEIVWRGALDAETAAAFRHQAEAALAVAPRQIVLRLDDVARLDSSGVGAIVFLHRRLAEGGGRLHVAGLSGQPLELARLIRLDAVLSVAPAASETSVKLPRRVFAALADLLRPAVAARAGV
jgi:anti-anti-sigma factor